MPVASWRKQLAGSLRRVAGKVSPASVDDDAAPSRSPSGSPTSASGEPFEQLLRLLFPSGLDDHQRALVDGARGDDDPFAPATVRRMLGVVDQQSAPSSVVVRFGPDDLERVEVDGATLVLDRADASVSVQIHDDGHYEPYVAAVLDDLLAPGHVFVDVGANVGYHTVRAATAVGSAGKVLAVEANPENARLLALTMAVNGFDHVEVLPLALGERRGFVHFGSHIGSNGGFAPRDDDSLAAGRGTVVPCIALDDLQLDRVDVIKIDVEGAESIVIAGAVDTIRRCRPAIVMEFSCEMTERVGGIAASEHLQRLVDLGYTLHLVDRSGGSPIPIASVTDLLATWGSPIRIDDLLALPT